MKSKKIVLMGLSMMLAASLLSACAEKSQTAEPNKGNEPASAIETVYGKVTDATMATVTLTAEDGSSCTIARNDDTAIHSGNGILVDDYVQVVYTGSLTGGSAVARSIVVSSETGEKTILGTVQDAANASLTVLEDGSGKLIQIVKTDDTIQTVSNNIGDHVEVTYRDVTGDGYPMALEIK